ncbi:PREDICTED: uncharacterized protein LOC105003794, partial [Bison bison bison]|uniref:Uncharacterized protein LOC105003794 n=1 Tax=Bison bison bison TaxID=43346 RepID=A0A6P3J6N5_BISBB
SGAHLRQLGACVALMAAPGADRARQGTGLAGEQDCPPGRVHVWLRATGAPGGNHVAERTPKKKPAVQSPEKQRPKGRSSDGASAPPPARSAGVGVPSSGPTGESPPPDPSFEAAEDVGQFQLPPISLEGPVGGTVVGGGPGLARQSAHSPRGQLPSSPQDQPLFWPHFDLGAVEPPAGWLPCLFQSENALALTLTPGFPPGTQHSVLWQAHKEVGEPEVSSTSGASHPVPAGMGPWLALWVLLYLPRALQGQSPHTRAAPSSVLQSFEDSKFQGEWYVLGLAGNTHTVADRSLLSPFTATFVLNKNNHLEAAYAMIRVRAPGPASQLKSRAQPELSQARHGPETPSLERVPRVHFGSGSRPRNGQRVDLMEATDGGQRCVTWSYELISQSQPGTFSVDHRTGTLQGRGCQPGTNLSLSAGHHPFLSLFPVHPRVYQPGGVGCAQGRGGTGPMRG